MKFARLLVAIFFCLISLAGCSTGKLDGEGEQFVSGVLDKQKTHWDAATLAASMDSTSGSTLADVEKAFKMYSDVIGPIQAVNDIKRVNFQAAVGVNVPDYKGYYLATLTCAKAPATVEITALHRDGKWTIYGFNVKSDAFKNYQEADRKGAQEFVDLVTKQICNSWKIEVLADNADRHFARDLKTQSVILKGVFLTCEKTLGAFKDYTPARFLDIKPHKTRTMYEYVAQEPFEKGEATLQYTIVKTDAGWKIAGFHVQTNVGNGAK